MIEDAVRIYKREDYVLHLCQRQVNGILEPARRVKFESLTVFRDVNHDRVDTALATLSH
jgi:hypothetical protein